MNKLDFETIIGMIVMFGFILMIIYSFIWLIGIDLL